MNDADRRSDETPPPDPQPTSWDEKQKDIGGALLIGAVALIVLLGLLVWKGLF